MARSPSPVPQARRGLPFDPGCVVATVIGLALAGVALWLALRVAEAMGLDPLRLCGTDPVQLTPRVVVAGRTAQVDIATNLPDGALIWTWFDHPRMRGFPPHDGVARVQDGHVTLSEDLSDLPRGPINLTAEFSVGWWDEPQPSGIVDRYGPTGWCIDGPTVTTDSGGERRLWAKATFDLP